MKLKPRIYYVTCSSIGHEHMTCVDRKLWGTTFDHVCTTGHDALYGTLRMSGVGRSINSAVGTPIYRYINDKLPTL